MFEISTIYLIGAILAVIALYFAIPSIDKAKKIKPDLNPYIDDKWDWDNTRCPQCIYFDGYDICMRKGNYGTVTTEKLNKCYNKNFYKWKGKNI